MKISHLVTGMAASLLLPASLWGASSIIRWRPAMEPGSGGAVIAISVSPWDGNRVLAAGDLLGITLSTDGGKTWQPTFGLPSYEMGSFTWHPSNPNIAWAGSMSGPCLTEDGGLTWKTMRNGMPPFDRYDYSVPIEKILFDPADATHLLAFGGSHRKWESPPGSDWGSIWTSHDSGHTWTRLTRLGDGSAYGVMAATYAGGALYAATSSSGIWKSQDNGATWQPVNAGLQNLAASSIIADPSGKTIYAAFFSDASGAPGGIYRSVDAGASWSPMMNGLTDFAYGGPFSSSYAVIEQAQSQPNLLLTADLSWDANVCYRSTDGGTTWQPTTEGQHFYDGTATAYALSFDPHNSNSAFMATIAAINRSEDGGLTWQDATASQLPDGLWRGGGFSGLVATNVIFNPARQQIVLMAMDDGKWVESDDNLASWRWGGNGMNHYEGGNDATFAGVNGSTVYAGFGQNGQLEGIGKSTDGGLNWTYVNPGSMTGQPLGIYALAGNPNQVWVTSNGVLYNSSDGGGQWARVVSNGIENDGGLRYIAAANDQVFYINGAAGVWRTQDAGRTFTMMAGSPAGTERLLVDPNGNGRLYVTKWRTESGDGLYRFDGNGWTLLRAEYAARNVTIDPTDSRRIVLCTDDDPYHDVTAATGVWMSEDDGVTWNQQNEGLPLLRGEVVRFVPWNPSQIIFGTNGRGFWTGTLHSVADSQAAAISGIVNSASFATGASLNGFVTIFGANFTSTTEDWSSAIGSGRILPVELGGVQVRIDGWYTYPSYVSPGQLNVLMPAGDGVTETATVEVVTDNGIASATARLSPVTPEFFAWQENGVQYAAALFANTSTVVSPAHPAQAGDIVQLYASCLGPTAQPWPAGYVFGAGESYAVANPSSIEVLVGGRHAGVLWAGMVEPGLYQINVQIPTEIDSGDVPVTIQAGGTMSVGTATLRIR